jgi:hypothetical protein
MSGYTPLFGSLTTGTLCGKWPDIGLWPIVLSLTDSRGVVDVTPAYIASVTGLGIEDVVACMARFCEPDPYSRTTEHDGRRLELVDSDRAWGWRVVNHGKYREKARLAAKNAREIEEGKNRERMNHRREGPPVTAGDRRSPPVTDPSNSNSNSNSKTLRSSSSGDLSPSPSGRVREGEAQKARENREALRSRIAALDNGSRT